MENRENQVLAKQEISEELPPLFKHITSITIAGFDVVEDSGIVNHQSLPTTTGTTMSCRSADAACTKVADATAFQRKSDAYQVIDSRQIQSISISMPSSPSEINIESTGSILSGRDFGTHLSNGSPNNAAASTIASIKQSDQAKYHSQPIPAGSAYAKAIDMGRIPHLPELHQNPRVDKLKDKRFDSFKTWSGKLERQISHLRGRQQEPEPDGNDSQHAEVEALPVDRYFAALEGPELDTLRASEELVLPKDKMWPFLLRFPVPAFAICLGVSSQAILWKTLATSASTSFLHVSLNINLVLWCISVALMITVSSIYSLKVIFYFEAVRREYYHPVRVNFFFAPWIALLFLTLGAPPSIAKLLHSSCWYILMAPILCLELKIYGQWMSGGQRRLSKVANPTNHLSVVGNFVGALLGASMGLKEGPIFFFAVGLAHYIVLFVTLYQRLPTNQALPKELHPVFFLFVAAPCIASMAWARIQGSFDHGSRIAYFIGLFLYCSLAVRINFFRGFRFSLAWWAYTFPMTGASVATIKYSNEVTNSVTRSLAVILAAISTFAVTALFISTVIHALVLKDLFPNDIAIAIAQRRPKKTSKKWFNLIRTASSETKDTESSVKSTSSNAKLDIES